MELIFYINNSSVEQFKHDFAVEKYHETDISYEETSSKTKIIMNGHPLRLSQIIKLIARARKYGDVTFIQLK